MVMFDWRWPAFLTRVTAGLLFGMAGVHKMFIMTPQVHARKLFFEPYQHTWIPHFLLWPLGVGIPFLELTAGWLLVARLSPPSGCDQPQLSAPHGYLRPRPAGTPVQCELAHLPAADFAPADAGSASGG
jgi:hypothetical protein